VDLTYFIEVVSISPAVFTQRFFQLATGLERLMKIVFILDHQTKHVLENPADQQLRAFGHSIIDLYEKCKAIAVEQTLSLKTGFLAAVRNMVL
jgi:hypothetical protein